MVNLRFWERKPRGEPVRTLGSYEIIRELGRGTMGVVYLGRNLVSGREVAIKTLALASDFPAGLLEDAKSRFLEEANILISLNHPDIISLYGVGEDRPLLYIAMEFAKGVPLAQYTQPGNLLPLPTVLDIVARAADALGYAHEQNIVHRDIKPGNIMYDVASNSVKLTDFGIAQLKSRSGTRPGVVLGSPLYMSPEQVMAGQIDGSSDLFSLGATLFHLACGRPPFEAESDIELMRRIATQPHADILSIRPDLPACVCAIIRRALAKDRGSRYATGYDMAKALRACAAAL